MYNLNFVKDIKFSRLAGSRLAGFPVMSGRFSGIIAGTVLAVMLIPAGCATENGEVPSENSEQPAASPAANDWELVWNDEFEGDGLPDPGNWSYEVGYIRNNEAQYYTEAREKNIRQEGGYLIIEAHKESYEGFDYTSASINTRDSQTWTHGRFEVRAKLPTGTGTWPAIWMLGENISEVGWPACGEIDIMENVGFDPHVVHGYVHTEAYNHTRGTQKGASVEMEAPWENFHIYAIEWFEDRIDFFIDDHHYFTFENEGGGYDVWPFDNPHYLLLNLAIGGGWGGQHGIDDSIFPQQYLIDYVRVYQQADSW